MVEAIVDPLADSAGARGSAGAKGSAGAAGSGVDDPAGDAGERQRALVARLRAGDQRAWFEVARLFGPALTAAIGRFGARRFSEETVRDLTQETLAEVARRIERFDPARGVRFSTWLYAIARHLCYGEIDRRMAQKRGGGARPLLLDEEGVGGSVSTGGSGSSSSAGHGGSPGAGYERAIFRAKVYGALERVARGAPLAAFEAYRLRLSTALSSQAIAERLGVSEPSVSRYLRRIRDLVREEVRASVAAWSFTDEERGEVDQGGLGRADDALFDEAIAELYGEELALREGSRP